MHFTPVLISIGYLCFVWGSVGDRLPEFKKCLKQCTIRSCPLKNRKPGQAYSFAAEDDHDDDDNGYYTIEERQDIDKSFKDHLPWYLRLSGWDCWSECQYNCMHKIHKERVESGEIIVQFFGKWYHHHSSSIYVTLLKKTTC